MGRRSLALSMRRPQNGRGQSSNSGATSASESRLNIHGITGKVRIGAVCPVLIDETNGNIPTETFRTLNCLGAPDLVSLFACAPHVCI